MNFWTSKCNKMRLTAGFRELEPTIVKFCVYNMAHHLGKIETKQK